jgi:hypothetical protein
MTIMRLMTWCCFGAALALGLAACADGTGPGTASATGAALSSGVRTAADAPSAGGQAPAKLPAPVQVAGGLPILETYDTSLTLVQGRASEDTLYFQAGQPEMARVPFMVLSTPYDAGFEDDAGDLLPQGSTVQFSVQVERQKVIVHFGQEGYASSDRPTTVKLLLADIDFMGRPGADLRLWNQSGSSEDSTWIELPSQISPVDGSIGAAISRRSNYAVAY